MQLQKHILPHFYDPKVPFLIAPNAGINSSVIGLCLPFDYSLFGKE